jgi:fimbrial chaperone protein
LRVLIALMLGLAGSASARAGGWDVNPIRVDLDAGSRTGAVTVHNAGTAMLRFQVSLARWTQNADGKDRYEPSRDLIYFPQMLGLAPDERRVIRVGTRQPPGEQEQSYRLFIEEIPDPEAADRGGTAVAVRVRFGVPVFVAAAAPRVATELVGVEREAESVQLRIRNDGNRHVKIDRLLLSRDGEPLSEAPGWYVLAGAERSFAVPVDASLCADDARAVELRLEGADLDVRHALDRGAGLCSR